VLDLLKRRNITFGITHANPRLPALLMIYDLLDKIGADHLYLTNRKAVEAFKAQQYSDDASSVSKALSQQ
jgi:hypothetical protein